MWLKKDNFMFNISKIDSIELSETCVSVIINSRLKNFYSSAPKEIHKELINLLLIHQHKNSSCSFRQELKIINNLKYFEIVNFPFYVP